jgi:hypothetical protein
MTQALWLVFQSAIVGFWVYAYQDIAQHDGTEFRPAQAGGLTVPDSNPQRPSPSVTDGLSEGKPECPRHNHQGSAEAGGSAQGQSSEHQGSGAHQEC